MHLWSALAVVGLVTGCDQLFNLQRVPDPPPLPDAPLGIDHDGDGVFADDNCPLVANGDQIDDDDDGIGNACDPRHGVFDEVVQHEAFDGDAPGWIASGTWTRAPGAWQSPDATQGGSLRWAVPRELNRPALQLEFSFDAYAPVENIHELVASLDAPGLIGDCSFRHNPNLSGSQSQTVLHVGEESPEGSSVPEYQFGQRYLATYVRELTSTCTVQGDINMVGDEVDRFVTAPTLTAKRIQVTLHHVTIYQVPP